MTLRTFRGISYAVRKETGSGKQIKGAAGSDWLEVVGSNNYIGAGSGDDVILANIGNIVEIVEDYPFYRGGAIFYDGGPTSAKMAGITWIDAGSGNDYVAVTNGNYIVDLGSGNNVFDGGATTGKIWVLAGNGNDIIDAGGVGGERYVNAGGGNNWIYLASGKAFVSAGAGDDVVTTTPIGTTPLAVYLGLVPELQEYAGVVGKPYKQSIDAGNGNNQIALPVFGQTDIKTGSGKDFILAGSVVRAFFDGPPNEDRVNIDSGGGEDTVVTLSTKSLIKTGSGNDTIFAGSGDDTIFAGSGNNLINLRGGSVPLPRPLNDVSFLGGEALTITGGGNDTVYLGRGANGRDTVILGSNGSAKIYGFGSNDRLDVTGLNASFTRSGGNTLISSSGQTIGILQGYTGKIDLL